MSWFEATMQDTTATLLLVIAPTVPSPHPFAPATHHRPTTSRTAPQRVVDLHPVHHQSATSTTEKFLGSRSLSVAMGKVVQGNQNYSPATIVYVASPAIQTTSTVIYPHLDTGEHQAQLDKSVHRG